MMAPETVNALEKGNGIEAGKCLSPVCVTPVESHPRAVCKRRYCSEKCRMDAWAFRRVIGLLKPLGVIKASNVLIDYWDGKE